MILNTLCVEVTDGSWTDFKRFASISHIYYFRPCRFNWWCAEKTMFRKLFQFFFTYYKPVTFKKYIELTKDACRGQLA